MCIIGISTPWNVVGRILNLSPRFHPIASDDNAEIPHRSQIMYSLTTVCLSIAIIISKSMCRKPTKLLAKQTNVIFSGWVVDVLVAPQSIHLFLYQTYYHSFGVIPLLLKKVSALLRILPFDFFIFSSASFIFSSASSCSFLKT